MNLERHRIELGKRPALLLVDIIKGFTDPACPLGSDCPDVVSANRELLDAFRMGNLPVFFTTVIYRHSEQARIFRKRVPALNVLEPESDWVKVDESLEPLPCEAVIEKCWASAFFDTDLSEKLATAKADSLVVTGLTTSGCVRASVLDGLQYDYPVWVPEEAVADRNQEVHKANLFDMHAKYAEVVKKNEVLKFIADLTH